MRIRLLAPVFSAVVILASFAFAQIAPSETEAEKAKKKKELDERVVQMLDQTVAEANSLRLPNNRAVVYAMVGDLYWRFDNKRSRELFRASAAEIATYNQEVEKERRESTEVNVVPEGYDPNDPRMEILSLIGGLDPDLALELMVPTRSTPLAEAMARFALTDVRMPAAGGVAGAGVGMVVGMGAGPGDTNAAANMDRQRAMQEIQLEERFKTQAAFSDPERAIKAIKDSLAKGISNSVIPLLQVVYRKDEKKATDLSGDVISKITGTDLAKNDADLNGAMGFLQYVARPVPPANPNQKAVAKVFSFSEPQVKDIANKLANTFLQPGTTAALTSALTRSLSTFEKVLPERIALLKQRDPQNRKSQPAAGGQNSQGVGRFYDPSMPVEDVLAQAAKLPSERDRQNAYQIVAGRIGQVTDDAKAKKLIDQIPDEKIRANALKQFENARIGRLASADKLDEARRAISSLADKKVRIQRLVGLAGQFKRKGTEVGVEAANELMTEAKGLTNPFPEDEDEQADLMEVIRGYAAIEPETAFRLIEPVIDQFNEIVQATAVLSKYNKRERAFKKGEMVMKVNGNPGSLLPFRYVPQIQMLGRADVERMITLVNRFQRSDSRTLMRLYVLQGYIRNVQLPGPGPGM